MCYSSRQIGINLLEENIGEIFSDINCTNVFLGQFCKATEITKINHLDLIKLTGFCTAKEILNKNEKTTYELG